MTGLYQRHREKVAALTKLPVGTTISFFKDGKERYVRKIRPTAAYPHSWYSMEHDASIPDERIPGNWSVLVMGHEQRTNKNAQGKARTGDKLCANFRY